MLVVGDIGGTKTAMALYGAQDGPRAPGFQKEYRSAAYPNLDEIVKVFLAEAGRPAEYGCFDVAGPVVDGRATITNLPWIMEEAALAASLGLRRVRLLNDLQAVAYAIPGLGPADRTTLNIGEADARGPIAVIAPGTGLGEAFLVWAEDRYVACASEGGHASFGPMNEREAALWRYLHRMLGAVSVERVCSGMGIANIYDFLRAEGRVAETHGLAAGLAQAKDRTPLIARAGLAGDPMAKEAMEMFAAILGAEAGNLALKIMATGGVYLAGGIPPRVLPFLQEDRFLQAFTAKGRLAPVLRRMPVHVLTVPAALIGAAQFGFDAIRGASPSA